MTMKVMKMKLHMLIQVMNLKVILKKRIMLMAKTLLKVRRFQEVKFCNAEVSAVSYSCTKSYCSMDIITYTKINDWCFIISSFVTGKFLTIICLFCDGTIVSNALTSLSFLFLLHPSSGDTQLAAPEENGISLVTSSATVYDSNISVIAPIKLLPSLFSWL